METKATTPTALSKELTLILGIEVAESATKYNPGSPTLREYNETKVFYDDELSHKQLTDIMTLGELSLKRSGAGITIKLKTKV